MVAQRFTAPASNQVVIHHATVFDGRTPVLCGRNDIPKPATSEWRYVSCPACLEIGARTTPAAQAALDRQLREAAAMKAANDVAPDPTFDLQKASGANKPAFQAHLQALAREHDREGTELANGLAKTNKRGRRRGR